MRELFYYRCKLALKRFYPQLVNGSVLPGVYRVLYDGYYSLVAQVVAENLVKAGRPMDAAPIYESIRMYDKARTLREKGKQVVLRKVDVSVDLNALLKQIKNGGFIVVYKCPNCSAPLKVGKDTKVESLRICQHCGSEIETVDIADFLRTALS